MVASVASILKDYRHTIADKAFAEHKENKKAESHTSLFALLYNKGAIMYSDLQATSNHRLRSSSREDKIYQISEDGIVVAGTGSVSGIMYAAEKAQVLMNVWKSRNNGRQIPAREAGDLIAGLLRLNPGLESYFLMGAYDHERDMPFIANISDDGCVWQTNLFETDGSGSVYIYPRGEVLAAKALSTLPPDVRENVVIISDIYSVIEKIVFPLEVALPLGLDAIASGPKTDVFSGGEGFQVMQLDSAGVKEYIIPKQRAQDILNMLHAVEFDAVQPKGSKRRNLTLESHMQIFEQCRRR